MDANAFGIGGNISIQTPLLELTNSQIAAASLCLAAKVTKRMKTCWNKEMEKACSITEKELQSVIEDVKSFVVEVNPKFLSTLNYKFSKQEYLEVAQLELKF